MITTESTFNKGTILLVDDLPENLQLLSELLIQLGYTIRSVTSGKMALKTLKVKQPDLILLDIKMPEMDGYQVCTAIKADTNLCEIPVIFISTLDDALDKVKAFTCGGVDYITKPFQIEEVVARVENQLTIQRQKIALRQEIKKRQETEEVLHQSRALLASVLNSTLDGIVALHAVRDSQTGDIEDFRCVVINPVIAKAFNKNREDLIGELLFKKFIQPINSHFFNLIVAVAETGNPLYDDFYYPLADSSWYHCVAVKLGDGVAITVRDITARKKMELELQQLNTELQLQNKTLAENIKLREDIECITRHDLKTPLNSIMAYPQFMLLSGNNLTTQQRDDLEHILESGNAMLMMINNSLDLVKMEKGMYHYHPEPVDLLRVIQRIIKNLHSLIMAMQVNFKILIQGQEQHHPVMVLAEENLSYSLFANLIRNAIEASPISSMINIDIHYENENIVISIINAGSVPEAIRESFFEKYSTAGKSNGTGLGTYSAKLMTVTQNGTIAMTTDSKETCLTVTLPKWCI